MSVVVLYVYMSGWICHVETDNWSRHCWFSTNMCYISFNSRQGTATLSFDLFLPFCLTLHYFLFYNQALLISSVSLSFFLSKSTIVPVEKSSIQKDRLLFIPIKGFSLSLLERMCMCVCVCTRVCVCVCYLFSHIRLFATSWTVTRQSPLSMEFSRQAYWSALSFPSPGDLLTQGLKLGLLHCRQILYHLSHQGSPLLE